MSTAQIKIKPMCELRGCDKPAGYRIKFWIRDKLSNGEETIYVGVCKEHYTTAHPSRKTTPEQDEI
ncbi:MAG: hypothetical protein ACOC5G_04070 [Acidobacteriota bacterium]